MAKKMLIDATHPEETRVVVVDGNKVEDFDFELVNKRQLAGNIYLAKVTRVEPSLQAAFVEYGGNRHGFLAFSEIHPDYYQIPVADREALLAEEAREEAERAREEEDESRPRAAAGPHAPRRAQGQADDRLGPRGHRHRRPGPPGRALGAGDRRPRRGRGHAARRRRSAHGGSGDLRDRRREACCRGVSRNRGGPGPGRHRGDGTGVHGRQGRGGRRTAGRRGPARTSWRRRGTACPGAGGRRGAGERRAPGDTGRERQAAPLHRRKRGAGRRRPDDRGN